MIDIFKRFASRAQRKPNLYDPKPYHCPEPFTSTIAIDVEIDRVERLPAANGSDCQAYLRYLRSKRERIEKEEGK